MDAQRSSVIQWAWSVRIKSRVSEMSSITVMNLVVHAPPSRRGCPHIVSPRCRWEVAPWPRDVRDTSEKRVIIQRVGRLVGWLVVEWPLGHFLQPCWRLGWPCLWPSKGPMSRRVCLYFVKIARIDGNTGMVPSNLGVVHRHRVSCSHHSPLPMERRVSKIHRLP